MTFPEVVTAHIVTGRWDVLLYVRSRSHQALQDFVVGRLPASPEFVRSETMVCWEARRRSTGAFLTDHDAQVPVNGDEPPPKKRAARRASSRRNA